MKTQLTKEESQHLIDLGISKDYASWRVIGIDVDTNMPLERLIEESQVEPYFTLDSILEILPKAINVPLKGRRELLIHYANINGNDYPLVCYTVPYDAMGGIISPCYKEYEELIDSLYELCVWCLENKYLKFN